MTKKELLLKKMNDLPFKGTLDALDGKIYAVGGILRDVFLEKESKDFDIMITNIDFKHLISILEQHGKVDLVGESFGIIKFKEFGSTEDIDISLPRKEISTGGRGHKAFEVMTDPFLPIESDLIRRDLTINSMAMDCNGNLIDPFDGHTDLVNGQIRMTNPITFFEDPLRMLRAVVFASRFEFEIEHDTLDLIIEHKARLKEIAPERILIELDKIQKKGNINIGILNLVISGLYKEIFGTHINMMQLNALMYTRPVIKTMGEFMYTLCALRRRPRNLASDFWREVLKGDIDTLKEIKALEAMSRYQICSGFNLMLKEMFNAFKISPKVVHTQLWTDVWFERCIEMFRTNELPTSLKEIKISGDYLVEIGISGPRVGEVLDLIVDNILAGELENEEASIKSFCIELQRK